MSNLYFDFIVPIRKRTKRARSASNPWIRNGLPSSSTTASKKTPCRQEITTEGSKEFRECRHCKATETPQWRKGPMGLNTLCNPCGIRYSTGRLFPEYRPANSPTFVPTLHSTSHRKVVEMRRKGDEEATMVDEDYVKRDTEEEKKMEEAKK